LVRIQFGIRFDWCAKMRSSTYMYVCMMMTIGVRSSTRALYCRAG